MDLIEVLFDFFISIFYFFIVKTGNNG